MAIATITCKDNDDGTTSVTVEFDPPIETYGECSPAQGMAFRVMESLAGASDCLDSKRADD